MQNCLGKKIFMYYVTHFSFQHGDKGVGKVEEWNGACSEEGGRTGDRTVGVIVAREGFGGWENMSLLSRAGRVAAAWSLHRHSPQTLQPPSCMAALVLSNNRMNNIKNGSFSGLDLLERPLCFLLPRRPIGIHGPLYQAVWKPEVPVGVCGPNRS